MNDKTGKKDKMWVYDKETKRDVYIDKSEYDANKHAKEKRKTSGPGEGMKIWVYDKETKKDVYINKEDYDANKHAKRRPEESQIYKQKKKIPSGSVITSSGKVLKGIEVAKGGIVKRYKGGLMVKPKAAKRGY